MERGDIILKNPLYPSDQNFSYITNFVKRAEGSLFLTISKYNVVCLLYLMRIESHKDKSEAVYSQADKARLT